MPIHVLSILCAQLTRDLLAIAKFLLHLSPDDVCLGKSMPKIYRHDLSTGMITWYKDTLVVAHSRSLEMASFDFFANIVLKDILRHSRLLAVTRPSDRYLTSASAAFCRHTWRFINLLIIIIIIFIIAYEFLLAFHSNYGPILFHSHSVRLHGRIYSIFTEYPLGSLR